MTILEMTGMQDIAVVHLDIFDLKVGDAVNNDITSIVLLSTRLSVEAGLVKENTKGGVFWDVCRGLEE